MKKIISLLFILFFSTCLFAQTNLDSALLEASYANNIEEIQILLKKGADVNAKTTDGVTPLMYATQNNNLEIVKTLVYNGAVINFAPDNGRCALITAVINNNLDIADYLVQNGAKINSKDDYSISSLIYASAYGYYYIADMLLYYGADISQISNDGTNALMIASMKGNTNIDSLIITKGAEINSKDIDGFTPLMLACQEGKVETVDFLLSKGANKSLKNKYGNDALMFAVQNNHPEIVELLLKNQSDNSTIDKQKLLIKTAYINNNHKIIKTLKQHNIKSVIFPIYNTIHYGITNTFNHQDDMIGGIVGVYDCKYKTSIDYSFYTRMGAKRILVESSPNIFYQYWERRSLMALTLQKSFVISAKTNITHGLFIGGRETYTYGKYRASVNKPDTKFILVPQLGYSLSGKIASIKVNYEYLDFKTYQVSPHRINLEFLINMSSFHHSKQNKAESYWLKNI